MSGAGDAATAPAESTTEVSAAPPAVVRDEVASQPTSLAASAPVLGVAEPGAAVAAVAPSDKNQASATAAQSGATARAGRKTAVSAAVNADQAALTGALTKAWSVIASLSTSVGAGTFDANPYTRGAFVSSGLSIEPAYIFVLPNRVRIRASARGFVNWEYTTPDNNVGRRFDWGDVLLGASARVWRIPVVDVDVFTSFRMPIPLSRLSLANNLVTAVLPGLGAAHNFQWTVREGWSMTLTLRYDLSFRKNFNTTAIRTLDRAPPPAGPPTVLVRGSDIAGNELAMGFPSLDYAFSNGLTVSWSPIESLSLTLFGAITNSVNYPLVDAPDRYTPPNAFVGAGRADSVRTNIDLTWTALPQLFVSMGVFTAAPLFRPDNQSLYFPLFIAGANNLSSFYLSLTTML